MSEPKWEEHELRDLFAVHRESVVPAAFPNVEFHHHSLPAWDEYRGPVVENGAAIESNKTEVTDPCVLVSKLNPRKPRVSVVESLDPNTRHCASTEFVCFRPKTEQSLRYWGYYFSGAKFSHALERHAIGSTNSHTRVSPRDPLGWRISVPPVCEQELIAQVLDTLDTQIRRTEALIAKLERIKQGLLTDLLTRGIDENGQLRPPPEKAPHLYKDSPLGRIPKEWEVRPFLEVANLPSGQVSPLAPEYSEMPLVAPDHIESGTAKLIKLESVREQGAISGKYLFQAGDIIYSKIRPYLNKMWLADRDGLCSADMYPLRPMPGVSSVFLLLVVMGERFLKFANSVSMRTGIPKINRDELSSYQLAVPTVAEQSKIEKALSSINQRLSMERQTLTKLMYENPGLLDDLLTGRVRVTPLLDTAKQAYG